MDFLKRAFAEEGFLSFRGRINRAKYIKASLICFVLFAVFALLVAANISLLGDNSFIWFLTILIYFMICIYSLANNIKRLHDLNISGAWMVAWIVITYFSEIVSLILLLVCASVKGTNGPNIYGSDPLEGKQESSI